MIRIIYSLILVVLISCGEKKEAPVTDEMKAEEVSDTSTVEKNDTNTVVKSDSVAFSNTQIDAKLPFEEKVNKFIEKYKLMYSETEVNKPIVPERYEAAYSKKIMLRKNTPVKFGKVENVYPIAQLFFFQYTDSTACRNVLNNWLQCYGFDCTPVEFMKDLPAIKTTPSMAIINEKEIIFLQYQCEHIENNWDDFKRELEKVFGSKTYYTLTLNNCGKKLIWKKVE